MDASDIEKLRQIAEGVGAYAHSDRMQALEIVRMYDLQRKREPQHESNSTKEK